MCKVSSCITQPVIKAFCVSYPGSQGLQQLPVEAVPPWEGLAVGEQEAHRVVPGEADVAVRPVGDVFHQPFNTNQRGGVDVQCCTWHRNTKKVPQTHTEGLRYDSNIQ